MKQQALRSALLAQTANIWVDDKVDQVEAKTKAAVAALGDKLTDDKRILLIVPEKTPEVMRAYNNLPEVYVTTPTRVNVLQVANADTIVMTMPALQVLEKRLLNKEK